MVARIHTFEAHDKAVSEVSAQVKRFHEAKKAFRIYHGSTNSTRASPYRHDNIVNTSGLNNVLTIDTQKRQVHVEPNVAMDSLVKATLEHGLVPPVVTEFPGITVGGAFAGTAAESSSFRSGLFESGVRMIEIVLGNGDIVTASLWEREDLFHGAASSLGTLGVVTMLVIELVVARPYVALEYVKVHNIQDMVDRMQLEQHNSSVDHIDGIMFAENCGLLCLGKSSDNAPLTTELKRFSRPEDDWFFVNAENLAQDRQSWTEYIPLCGYLWRYNRGAFWIGKYTYRYFAIPCNRFTRWLLDRYTHTRVMYQALHQSGLSDKYVIQDVAIPYENAATFFDYLGAEFRQYPIWLCPLRIEGGKGFMRSRFPPTRPEQPAENPRPNDGRMLNFGLWAPIPTRDTVAFNRALEAQISGSCGWKWLYSQAYYTEEEFWRIYDRTMHDELRYKYHATHLPTLYNKVKVHHRKKSQDEQRNLWTRLCVLIWNIWPLAGLYGWLHCIVAQEYLLPNKVLTAQRTQYNNL